MIIRREVGKHLEAGVIEPLRVSAAVLVPNSDGSIRFCVHIRTFNSVTVTESYPLSRRDDCIGSLGEAKVFSTLDCSSSFWQLPVLQGDKNKMAFFCHAGTYRSCRGPFGLHNATETFQRALDILLLQYR